MQLGGRMAIDVVCAAPARTQGQTARRLARVMIGRDGADSVPLKERGRTDDAQAIRSTRRRFDVSEADLESLLSSLTHVHVRMTPLLREALLDPTCGPRLRLERILHFALAH